MNKRLVSLCLVATFSFSLVACSGSKQSGTPMLPQAQTPQSKSAQALPPRASANPTQNIPVSGTATNAAFSGTFSIQRFVQQNGALYAVGTLTGTLTNTLTNTPIGTVNQTAQLPVTAATGSCPILSLTLGPLDLNLLGLMVHLDQVVLNITAQSGPGNLLGNLLCAVAHLLDGGAPLGSIAGLLNNILRILSGL